MRTSTLYFLFSFTVFFQLNAIKTHGQEFNVQDSKTAIWVDSVFESLSITDRINQMLVLQLDEKTVQSNDLPNAFGGILLKSKGPIGYGKTVNNLQRKLLLPTLVFAQLGVSNGIALDSIQQFGSDVILSAISEPNLLYETGQAIATQCRFLGINGLIPKADNLLFQEYNELSWRLNELNQGFSDNDILILHSINFTQFQQIDLKSLMTSTMPEMIMINVENVPEFHEFIQKSIAVDQVDLEVLYEKCKQILSLKYINGLKQYAEVEFMNLYQALNNPDFKLLQRELVASSLTVLKNDLNLIPVSNLENKKIASLTIGKQGNQEFQQTLEAYAQVDHFQVSYYASDNEFADLWTQLNGYDLIIAGLYDSEYLKANFNGTESYGIFMNWLNESEKTVIAFFGDLSHLRNANFILDAPTFLIGCQDDEQENSLVPQLIFGGIDAEGVLPISINENIQKGQGIALNKLGRFGYTLPEEVGLDSKRLCRIDSIVKMAIQARATPGCQVLIARDNQVVFRKSYGYQTYDSLLEVTNDDLYDLASLTKVSGALPALMKLYQEGKFDLDATLGTYLPYYKRGNKKEITFREILAHQSGMIPYIVYWQTALKKNGKYRRKTLSTERSEEFPYEISPGLFVYNDYKEKIYKQIKKSKMGEQKYLYSGLTFFLFPDIIEKISGEKYEDYINSNFYKPLGATTLTYNPMDKFAPDLIVPTEYDSTFRKSLVHGKVHDEGAAMMAGVSGNAGLFADANDLGKLFQMYCNYGSYGGREYLNEETIREFTRCQYPENDNRRALGFDRPMPITTENGNTAISASQLSFGHTGFTGTFAWADPEYNLVYIFLSNRVYPTRQNTKLYDMNIRTNIQQVIYDAMK